MYRRGLELISVPDCGIARSRGFMRLNSDLWLQLLTGGCSSSTCFLPLACSASRLASALKVVARSTNLTSDLTTWVQDPPKVRRSSIPLKTNSNKKNSSWKTKPTNLQTPPPKKKKTIIKISVGIPVRSLRSSNLNLDFGLRRGLEQVIPGKRFPLSYFYWNIAPLWRRVITVFIRVLDRPEALKASGLSWNELAMELAISTQLKWTCYGAC